MCAEIQVGLLQLGNFFPRSLTTSVRLNPIGIYIVWPSSSGIPGLQFLLHFFDYFPKVGHTQTHFSNNFFMRSMTSGGCATTSRANDSSSSPATGSTSSLCPLACAWKSGSFRVFLKAL